LTFTSGGTEANSLALHGALQAAAAEGNRFTRLIVSAIEHDSVLQTALRAAEVHPGLRTTQVAVNADGVISLEDLKAQLSGGKGRALVSVMAVNNETGVVQPVHDIAEICRRHGAVFHCDAVQAAGKMSVQIDADFLTLSAHKLGGPQGTGALIRKAGIPLATQLRGGSQEFGLRAGTENAAAIAGFGAAARAARSAPAAAGLHGDLEQRLRDACPEAIIFGATARRVGTTTCIAVPGVPAETLIIALDLDGFAVSAGSACSSGRIAQSHVLAAMGVDPAIARCTIRISSGWQTRPEDLVSFAQAWTRIVSRARSRAAA
jgi:cysteine desulfurase